MANILPPPPNPNADINDFSWRDWFRQLGVYVNNINKKQVEVQVATENQLVFILKSISYIPGTNTLSVFVDGLNQIHGSDFAYLETNATTVTFTNGLHKGALVKFVVG